MTTSPNHLILWCDLETTGSTVNNSDIIEYAFILTDATPEFNEVWRDSALVYCANLHIMNDVVMKMHTESGLLDDFRDQTMFRFDSVGMADTFVYNSIIRAVGPLRLPNTEKNRKITLAGSGVSHFDSLLLQRQMPLTWSLITGFEDSDFLKPTLDLGVVRRFFNTAGKENSYPWSDPDPNLVAHRAMNDAELFLKQSREFMTWLNFQ